MIFPRRGRPVCHLRAVLSGRRRRVLVHVHELLGVRQRGVRLVPDVPHESHVVRQWMHLFFAVRNRTFACCTAVSCFMVARARVSDEDAEESVVFQLDVRTGTKLAGLGVAGEAEVLLMPGVRLLVTNIDRREHSLVDAHSSAGTVTRSHVSSLRVTCEWSRIARVRYPTHREEHVTSPGQDILLVTMRELNRTRFN